MAIWRQMHFQYWLRNETSGLQNVELAQSTIPESLIDLRREDIIMMKSLRDREAVQELFLPMGSIYISSEFTRTRNL